MILDSLENAGRYRGIHPLLDRALDWLPGLRAAPPAEGRVGLDGERVFALIGSYRTGPDDEARFETHARYADIQFLLEGREIIRWTPLRGWSRSRRTTAGRTSPSSATQRGTRRGDGGAPAAGPLRPLLPGGAAQAGPSLGSAGRRAQGRGQDPAGGRAAGRLNGPRFTFPAALPYLVLNKRGSWRNPIPSRAAAGP